MDALMNYCWYAGERQLPNKIFPEKREETICTRGRPHAESV